VGAIAAGGCPALKKLDIRYNIFGAGVGESIAHGMYRSMGKLEELSLGRGYMSADEFSHVATALYPMLRVLDLGACCGLSQNDLQALAKAIDLGFLKGLEQLEIR